MTHHATDSKVIPIDLITDGDVEGFSGGHHARVYEKLGAHVRTVDGRRGTGFAVWAPDAEGVSVMGDFNGWNKDSHPLQPRGSSGVWQGFVPNVGQGEPYKYHVRSRVAGYRVDKADPYAFRARTAPDTVSVVWDLDYEWGDTQWLEQRRPWRPAHEPISIYEVHLGSWRRPGDDPGRFLGYRELAPLLADHMRESGFSHVEFLPVMEHPFYGSWGYQVTSFFAPSGRYGTPQDFMYLIDHLHQAGIGVILDWVPSHFPKDEHGLGFFDGTHLYEHADTRKGLHPDWDSLIFNYDRHEVRSFLLSNAMFWLDRYHVDGLRVDAVASMLYLDYSRKEGEWIPNEYGGNENLGAISFLRLFNEVVHREHPDVMTIAEESTAWPMVSRPTYLGGLGFDMKWDMGWMHDTLLYMGKDPIHRKYHHNQLTFRMLYAHTENFALTLSHDEVVHGKGSLVGKQPGDWWQKFANLRLLFGWMHAQQGKKLLFMGDEFGQWNEWNHDVSLDWHLLDYSTHGGVRRWVGDLNRMYRAAPALHELEFEAGGFEWIDCADSERSVISVLRKGKSDEHNILAVFNFTPEPRHNYRVGVPWPGQWRELLNSDSTQYGGSGQGNFGGMEATPVATHGKLHSLNLVLPPLSAVFFRHDGEPEEPA